MTQDIMKLADELTNAARNWPIQNPTVEANARIALQSAVEALQAERDALAAKLQALQEQEPVAYKVEGSDGTKVWAKNTASVFAKHYPTLNTTPLYTAPKALEPLTEERIQKILRRFGWCIDGIGEYTNQKQVAFARAIEAARGIGGQP